MDLKSARVAEGFAELSLEDERWLSFAGSAPDATPFHHPSWLRALTSTYRYRGFVAAQLDDAGGVTAGLPLLSVWRPLAGTVYVSLPFTDHVPPLARSEEALVALSGALASWRQKEQGAPGVEVRGSLAATENLVTVNAGVRHVLSLKAETAELRHLKPSVARHVKSAERALVQVRFGRSSGDLATFYRLHLQTRRRLGVPVQPWRFMRAIQEHVLEPGLGYLALAEDAHGVPLAAALFLTHNGTIVYKYGASDASQWHLRPNHLLFWRVIERSCAEGFRLLDFGRSDAESQGLRQFKAGWGAVEVPLQYTRLGGGRPAAGGTRRLGNALEVVIRRSPPFVCRALGELLYRYAA
jgi:CelD/BcsL family acetyltransferase involved in cellulose biosynthesis